MRNVGDAVGLKPAETVAFDPRSLKEIEAQLVTAYRRYQITEEYIGRNNELLSRLQGESIREDALAPARLLVARLRELEDQAVAELTVEEKRRDSSASLALKARARRDELVAKIERWKHEIAEKRGWDVKKLEETASSVSLKEINDAPSMSSLKLQLDLDTAAAVVRKQQSLASIQADEAQRHEDDAAGGEREIEKEKDRIATIRKLVTWAREHFKNVELTIDEAAKAK